MTKTLTLRSFDIPAIHKFGIGFDNLFDDLMRVTQHQASTNYPPHNVIKTGDDTVTIEVAVAGFAEGEIDISLDQRQLVISGAKATEQDQSHEYLHRGVSQRDFKQTFPLSEHVEVNGASISNGILTVYLERKVPESAKPKSIAITYAV
ncbi:Hsp20 family protein [Haliscomenobacter sp.]|uniref:Hsp20 family protein n=1 Tax=Haliscomenobacter sp. TaxID=2717303 RepID=UPI003364EEE4